MGDSRNLGKVISDVRESMGISQLHLAINVGISKQRMNDIEKGRIRGFTHIPKILEVLNLDPDKLKRAGFLLENPQAARRKYVKEGTLAHRLAVLRKQCNYSVRGLGAAAGLSPATISKLEVGKGPFPAPRTLQKLEEVFGKGKLT